MSKWLERKVDVLMNKWMFGRREGGNWVDGQMD